MKCFVFTTHTSSAHTYAKKFSPPLATNTSGSQSNHSLLLACRSVVLRYCQMDAFHTVMARRAKALHSGHTRLPEYFPSLPPPTALHLTLLLPAVDVAGL